MNLENAKKLAKELLHFEIEETPYSPIVVMHPVFESAILHDDEGIFNVLEEENKERYLKLLKNMEKHIDKTPDVEKILFQIIRKSYRITYIQLLNEICGFSNKECGNLLGSVWQNVEHIYDLNMSQEDMLNHLINADKNKLMDENKIKKYNELQDEIILFRGCKEKEYATAFSWTTDKQQAEWFAQRYGSKGYVFQCKIKKEDVLFVKDYENEVVINYNNLYDLELLHQY